MIFSDHNASIFERKSIKVFMGELKFLKKKKNNRSRETKNENRKYCLKKDLFESSSNVTLVALL